MLARMAAEPGVWKPFAGGTDLMVLLEAGKLPHKKFLNISESRRTARDRGDCGARDARRFDHLCRDAAP